MAATSIPEILSASSISGAELEFPGVPSRIAPKSLSGYVHYIPKPINYVKAPYLEKKGKLDSGKIEVVLTDWDKPYNIVTNDEEFIDGATDPHVIGRGLFKPGQGTAGGYIHFDIPIDYRSGKTPKYVVIIVRPASNLGALFHRRQRQHCVCR